MKNAKINVELATIFNLILIALVANDSNIIRYCVILLYIGERCGDIVVEGGVSQIVIAMKTFKQLSGIQTWGAYALCRILYCNSKCTNILGRTYHAHVCIRNYYKRLVSKYDTINYSFRSRVLLTSSS